MKESLLESRLDAAYKENKKLGKIVSELIPHMTDLMRRVNQLKKVNDRLFEMIDALILEGDEEDGS